jgi:hypothetical protein
VRENFDEFVCSNMEDGRLVFEPRGMLTEDEKERADLHVGGCSACQADMDFDFLMNRLGEIMRLSKKGASLVMWAKSRDGMRRNPT